MSSEGNEVKLVIGIISYLPRADSSVLEKRLAGVNKLIRSIGYFFPDVPIFILGQCWRGIQLDKSKFANNTIIKNYTEPLGINGARRALREWFINQGEYNEMIMLDDDAELEEIDGGRSIAKIYLDTIYKNPGKWGIYHWHLLKLCVIPKDIYAEIEIPDGGADSNVPYKRFFEDQYLQIVLERFWPERRFEWPQIQYNNKEYPMYAFFGDRSNSAYGDNSVWHDKVYDKEGKWDRHSTGNVGRKFQTLITNREMLTDKKLLNRKLEQAGKWILKHGEKDRKYLVEYLSMERLR